MQYYVGLDISVKETSVCIIDKAGKVIREVRVATEPVAIFAVLTEEPLAIERIGLEAGPLSQWLVAERRPGSPLFHDDGLVLS
jgi:transposase